MIPLLQMIICLNVEREEIIETPEKIKATSTQSNKSGESEISDIEAAAQQYIETDTEGKFRCTLCGKEAVGKFDTGSGRAIARSNLKKHIETHFEGLSFPCQLCGKIFRSRNALQIHNTRYHK